MASGTFRQRILYAEDMIMYFVKKYNDTVKECNDRIKEYNDRVKKYNDRVKNNGNKVENNCDRMENNGDIVENNGDIVKNNGDIVKNNGDIVKNNGDIEEIEWTPFSNGEYCNDHPRRFTEAMGIVACYLVHQNYRDSNRKHVKFEAYTSPRDFLHCCGMYSISAVEKLIEKKKWYTDALVLDMTISLGWECDAFLRSGGWDVIAKYADDSLKGMRRTGGSNPDYTLGGYSGALFEKLIETSKENAVSFQEYINAVGECNCTSCTQYAGERGKENAASLQELPNAVGGWNSANYAQYAGESGKEMQCVENSEQCYTPIRSYSEMLAKYAETPNENQRATNLQQYQYSVAKSNNAKFAKNAHKKNAQQK